MLNDSAAWTEEIARYLLICMVFIGMAGVGDARIATSRSISSTGSCRRRSGACMSTLVDLVRIVFFGYAVVLTIQMMQKMGSYKMTIVDLPMNMVYGVCAFGFACAAVRSVQVASSIGGRATASLERPETLIEESV